MSYKIAPIARRRSCDGAQALQAVAQAMPDLIVMDLGMPCMDGYRASRRIRSQRGSQRQG